MSQQSTSVSRRDLAKGAAWAVPVLAVSSVAPAFASSPSDQPCKDIRPTLYTVAQFHWGTLGAASTTQQLQLYPRLVVEGVNADTVESIHIDYYIERRPDGAANPGVPDATTASRDNSGSYQLNDKSGTATSVTETAGPTPHSFASGVTADAFKVSIDASGFDPEQTFTSGSASCGGTLDTGKGLTQFPSNGQVSQPISQYFGRALEYWWDGVRGSSSTPTPAMEAVYTITLKDGSTSQPYTVQIPLVQNSGRSYF